MKKRTSLLTVIVFACSSLFMHAQINDLGKMLSGGINDGEKMFEAYLTPYANAMGSNLSGGWYNTAKVHKLGGFDLTFTFNMAFVPDADKSFDLSELDLSGASFTESTAPTAAGKNNKGPEISYNFPPVDEGFSYNTPKGTGVGFLPAPMVQLGIGLIKDTEIIGRYLPTYDIGNTGSSVGLWGIGLKHGIKQYIPAINKIPVFHLTFMGGYTQLNTSSELSIGPQDFAGVTDATNNEINFDNQEMALTAQSYTFNIITSANLPVVCFYGGVGISITKFNLDLNGNYPVPSLNTSTGNVEVGPDDYVTDPFNLEIKNTDGSTTNPRLNVGMRLKFGPITLHGDYTMASYSVVTAGLGVTIR
jgi:hypothetical protein